MSNHPMEFTTVGYKATQRVADTLKKGEHLKIDEDCCFILLPIDWKNKNIVVIQTEE